MAASYGLTDTYNDAEELIHNIARAFQRKYGGSLDDLIGEANLHFLAAYDSYDMDMGKGFDSWVRYVVWNRLLETARQNAKRRKILGERVDLSLVYREPSDFNLELFMDDLSEDATTVVRILFDTENQTDSQLRRYLNSMGWGISRIFQSFNEIARVLRGD